MNILYVILFIIAIADFFTSIPFDGEEKSPPVIFIISIIVILLSEVIRKLFFMTDKKTNYKREIVSTTAGNKKMVVAKNVNKRQCQDSSSKSGSKEMGAEANITMSALHNYHDDIPARLVALAGLLTKNRITIEEYERRRNNLLSKSHDKK